MSEEQTINWEKAQESAKWATVIDGRKDLGRGFFDLQARVKVQDAEIAALRAECARKDSALRHLAESTRFDPGYPYSYDARTACEIMSEMRRYARAALTPSDAGKKWAAMARVCEGALKLGGITRIECQASNEDYAQWREDVAALRELEK